MIETLFTIPLVGFLAWFIQYRTKRTDSKFDCLEGKIVNTIDKINSKVSLDICSEKRSDITKEQREQRDILIVLKTNQENILEEVKKFNGSK